MLAVRAGIEIHRVVDVARTFSASIAPNGHAAERFRVGNRQFIEGEVLPFFVGNGGAGIHRLNGGNLRLIEFDRSVGVHIYRVGIATRGVADRAFVPVAVDRVSDRIRTAEAHRREVLTGVLCAVAGGLVGLRVRNSFKTRDRGSGRGFRICADCDQQHGHTAQEKEQRKEKRQNFSCFHGKYPFSAFLMRFIYFYRVVPLGKKPKVFVRFLIIHRQNIFLCIFVL